MTLIFEKFESFLDVVKKITLTELDKAKELLWNEGKDITNISDIFIGNSSEFFDILPDGTLIKVNLYIATQNIDRNSLDSILPKDLYKYHIYKCSTISKMFHSGRKHRYTINNRVDGTFHYKLYDFHKNQLEERKHQKLNICKICLGQFLHHYPSDYNVKNFNLINFHEQNHIFFDFDTSELEKSADARPNVYSERWREISTQFKIRKDYTCEKCGWRPNNSYQKRFIHTHHQNGDKTNNIKENLKVLCIECHSGVDEYHTQIKFQPNYKDFIKQKRGNVGNNIKSYTPPTPTSHNSIPYREITKDLLNQGFRPNTIYQRLRNSGWKVEYNGVEYQVYVKDIIRIMHELN